MSVGSRTKIDWCDATWNPVTGCLHGCEYCYARRIAERFGSHMMPIFTDYPILHEPVRCTDTYEYMREAGISAGKIQPYPFDFAPTLHEYKLQEPEHWRKPRTIFVCSMADLFGEWVPDEWIISIINTCKIASWHRYLFLTKNPRRYERAALKDILPVEDNFWYGTSTPKVNDPAFWSQPALTNGGRYYHTFVSIEPILERFGKGGKHGSVALTDWVIVGAETGNRKGKIIPEKSWIMELAEECDKRGKPIFMKESLRGIMGDDFRQEFPWEVQGRDE